MWHIDHCLRKQGSFSGAIRRYSRIILLEIACKISEWEKNPTLDFSRFTLIFLFRTCGPFRDIRTIHYDWFSKYFSAVLFSKAGNQLFLYLVSSRKQVTNGKTIYSAHVPYSKNKQERISMLRMASLIGNTENTQSKHQTIIWTLIRLLSGSVLTVWYFIESLSSSTE